MKKAYLYANNHFSAKSVANAAILKHQLGQPLPGEYPEEFVERYPDLKGLVKILRRRSFPHRSLLEHVGLLNLGGDVHALDDLAEDGVLAVELGAARSVM